jgi:hypothetical protein
MRYFVLPHEGLSDNFHAALTRGLGLSSLNTEACRRHCLRYEVEDMDKFIEELEEAQAALATAYALGAPVMVDWQGRLCYDVPRAMDKGIEAEDEAPAWQSDTWLASLFSDTRLA